MKKSIICLSAAFLSFYFTPSEIKASNTSEKIELNTDSIAERTLLVHRLEEIKAMDVSALNRSEKRALRKEVRSIDKNLRDHYGGVYISVGGLIIIILLLIILL